VAFARVTVNGNYLGIYSHVDSIRKPFLKRAFGNADGVLYEGTVVDFYPGWAKSFEHKRGAKAQGERRIQQVIDVLSECKDEELEAELGKVVALDAFYKYWALEGLLGFWDGYTGNRNNFFLYLHPETDRLHFLPWGADMAFMRIHPEHRSWGEPLSVKTSGLLAHRLYNLPAGRVRYQAELKSLLAQHWHEKALLQQCDRIEALVEAHLGKTQRRQSDRMDDVRDFIETRREELLAEIEPEMPLWNKRPDRLPVLSSEDWEGTIWAWARDGDCVALQRYVDDGNSVNVQSDTDGAEPLVLAAVAGQVDAVKLLLHHGARVNAKDDKNSTALHAAAFFGRVEVLEVLVKAGADLNAVNSDGETPYDAATAPWSTELQGVFEFFGGVLKLKLDLKAIRVSRPKAAELLLRHGGKAGK